MIGKTFTLLAATAALAGHVQAGSVHAGLHERAVAERAMDTTWVIETVVETVTVDADFVASSQPTQQAEIQEESVSTTTKKHHHHHHKKPKSSTADPTSEAAAPTTTTTTTDSPAPAPTSTTMVTVVSQPVDDQGNNDVPSVKPLIPTTTEQSVPQVETTTKHKHKPTTSATSSGGDNDDNSGGNSGSAPSGKRGIAYNDVSLAASFKADCPDCSWGFNWGSSSGGLSSDLEFIPLMHCPTDPYTGWWDENVSGSGAKILFSFNEPDMPTQCNTSPADAAAGHKQYMNKYSDQATIVSPAVSNSNVAGQGLDWLSSWIDECDGGCDFDAVACHWYNVAGTFDDLKDHVTKAHTMSGKPVYLSEFGLNGASDDEIESFLQDAIPWLESQDFVAGYAYFFVADAYLMSGTSLSSYGNTYATLS